MTLCKSSYSILISCLIRKLDIRSERSRYFGKQVQEGMFSFTRMIISQYYLPAFPYAERWLFILISKHAFSRSGRNTSMQIALQIEQRWYLFGVFKWCTFSVRKGTISLTGSITLHIIAMFVMRYARRCFNHFELGHVLMDRITFYFHLFIFWGVPHTVHAGPITRDTPIHIYRETISTVI
jgi:hypothetical protein